MVVRILKGRAGQAAIETALALPFLIWLVYYTINAFHAIHTSHVGQKYAAMNVYERVDNRAKFIVDQVGASVYTAEYLAVQYQDESGDIPQRRILLESKEPTRMLNIIGICREPGCR